jgi:hypothetical protein
LIYDLSNRFSKSPSGQNLFARENHANDNGRYSG